MGFAIFSWEIGPGGDLGSTVFIGYENQLKINGVQPNVFKLSVISIMAIYSQKCL